MSITDRLMAFSLGALAIVLAAFSGSVYLLVSRNAAQQVEDRAVATLDTLAAQCRWRPDGLAWTGESWDIGFPQATEPTIWAVFDEAGKAIETSRDLTFPIVNSGADYGLETGRSEIVWMDQPWVVFRRRLVHSESSGSGSSASGKTRHASLTLVTAWPYRGVQETKRNLARFLGLVSLATWCVSLIVGKWYCRRALSPLTEMAASVRAIDVDDLSFRLPSRRSADELRELTLAFDTLMDRLEEAFVRQSRFVSEASHQLRTPLAALLGQMDVALRRERDATEYRRTLEVSRGCAQRLQKIVESLLFLARREGSSQPVDLEPIELREWLEGHIEQVWSGHPRFDDLECVIACEPAIIRTHSAMLGQALDNYLDNALKYGDVGTRVIVRARVDGRMANLEVEDHGPGMDPDVLIHAFEPFYRSDQARRRGIEGLGLGLAIVARLAKTIEAVPSVASELGKGSIFRLSMRCEPVRFEQIQSIDDQPNETEVVSGRDA